MNAKKESEVWSAGFKHGYLASGVLGAEHKVRTVMRALDESWQRGYNDGWRLGYNEGKRASLDERLKATSEAARRGQIPTPPSSSSPKTAQQVAEDISKQWAEDISKFVRDRAGSKSIYTPRPAPKSSYFHTRITMAATASTIETWDNRESRGAVLIELHQTDPNNPKYIGERVAVGQSHCDPTDKWNALIGLKLAWERLIKDLCKNRPEFRSYDMWRWRTGAFNVAKQFEKITTVGGDVMVLTSNLARTASAVSRHYRTLSR